MMNDFILSRMSQIKGFLSESEGIEFNRKFRKEAYRWIEGTLRRFHYVILAKKDKGFIRRYLMKVAGYSRSRLARQIAQYRKEGQVRIKEYERNKFKKKYTPEDIQILTQTAQVHDSPNGAALKEILSEIE